MPGSHRGQRPLPYAPPQPPAPRPPLVAEVGCASSILGALTLGAGLPWWLATHALAYEGIESFIGGPAVLVLGLVVGAVTGAIAMPLVLLAGYWLVWQVLGRP